MKSQETKTNKIAIITPYGAEPRCDNYAEFLLAKGLVDSDFNLRFYTYKISNLPRYKRNTIYQGIKILRCRQRFGFAPGLFLSLILFRPDTIMMFHARSFLNFSAFCAAKIIGAKIISEIVGILHDPSIVNDRDDPLNTFKKDVNLITDWKKFFKSLKNGHIKDNWENFIFHMPMAQANKIIAISKHEQKYIKQFYNRDSEMIYWSIPQEQNLQLKKPEKVVLPNKYLFFIGQTKKRKGWDNAIKVLGILKKQNILKNLVFVSAPQGVTEAKKFAEQVGVENQITFLSQVSNEEKNWLYANAEYLLVPSTYEGFGLPVFESFLAKKPVLATNVPIMSEFLEHQKNALLSEAGDNSAMAENIKLLDNNPELIKKLTHNGTQTALNFNDKVMVDRYLEVITSL